MLFRSGIVIAFFTLLSRLFGLARELFIAATFGTTAFADCVNVAFKLPNLFRRIFGEGALSSVFIPMYSEKLVDSQKKARLFSGEIISLLVAVLIILTILLQILMPYFMLIIAPGFIDNDDKFDLAVLLCRITMPYMIFISIAATFGGILNSVRKFAAFAFSPIIMNACVILFPIFSRGYFESYYSISIALLIAGILQVSFMYFCLYRAELTFPIIFKPRDSEVRKLLRKMGPAAMSSGTQQLNLFISQSIASFIPGAVSILSYADRLYQLPLSLIGVTFGTILLPELSKIYKRRDYQAANILQNKAIKISCAISIPAMCGLCFLSHPIIYLIYQRGEFGSADTFATSAVLRAFSFGLPAFVLAKILMPIFYANLDTKTPFRIAIYSMVINTVLNILLMIPFGYVGIAMGSSFSAWINIYLLYKNTRQYGDFLITQDTKNFILKILFCSIIMSLYLLCASAYFNSFLYSSTFIIKLLTIIGTIISAFLVLVSSAYFLRLHENIDIR